MAKKQIEPIQINYQANTSAKPFHNSLAQVKALSGPVGSGKSLAASMEWFLLCAESTVPLRGLVLRETFPQLRDSTLKTLQEWFPEQMATYHKTEHNFLLTFPNFEGKVLTHELHLRHAQRAADASKFLSTEYALIWLEEPVPAFQSTGEVIGNGLPHEIFTMCLMRQRQKDAHRLHLILTFNPPPRYHWVYKEFFEPTSVELESRDFALYRQPPFENEAHLPPGYYKKLIEQLSPDLARRFVRGETVTMYPGVRVFPEAYETVHFTEFLEPMKGVELVIGFDFGLTPVALISQVLPNGQWIILDEIQMWNAGITRLADRLKTVINNVRYLGLTRRCWGDPAGAAKSPTDERTCFEILASSGFPVQPGAIDFTSRREAVAQRLERFIDGKPAVQIDRNRCPLLTEGLLGGYRFPTSSDNTQMGSRPVKNEFSHVADAAQYIATGEFGVTDGRLLQARRRQPDRLPVYDPLSRSPQAGRGRGSWMGQ